MAKYSKGQSGNPKGRPKGSTNEKTAYIRDWVISVIGANGQRLLQDFPRLSRKEQWRVITSLLPYAIPKQTEANIKAEVDLNRLTDDQLDNVIINIVNAVLNDEE